jgi:hypothetical protein
VPCDTGGPLWPFREVGRRGKTDLRCTVRISVTLDTKREAPKLLREVVRLLPQLGNVAACSPSLPNLGVGRSRVGSCIPNPRRRHLCSVLFLALLDSVSGPLGGFVATVHDPLKPHHFPTQLCCVLGFDGVCDLLEERYRVLIHERKDFAPGLVENSEPGEAASPVGCCPAATQRSQHVGRVPNLILVKCVAFLWSRHAQHVLMRGC